MFKRGFALILVLALVITAFVGCAKQEPAPAPEQKTGETEQKVETKEPQVLTINLGSDPETLDPNKASESVGFNILVNTYEGLTRLDENDKAIPGVAERWEISDDGLTYTFYLREDAKWSDGKPVTAYDFEYSWKRALDPATAADYAYQMYYIKNGEKFNNGEVSADELGIKVIDDKTIQVTLEGPTPWMLEMFAFPTYYPVRKDVVEANPDTWALEADTFICNGPFKVAEWKHNEVVKLVKNENYWGKDRVKLDEINVTLINEATTALAAFEAGDVDIIEDVPSAEIPRLQAESDEFMILPALGTYYYTFNNAKEPVNDERVRKALSLAIDRKAIVETVTKGGQQPATGFVPYGLIVNGKDFREEGGNYGIDPNRAKVEEARRLLAEAGYPDGKGFPKITIRYNTSEGHKRIAEAIQEMWKKNLNIDVELENIEWKVYLKELEAGNYVVGRIGWLADYAHPMTFLDMWITGSGNNYTNWSDPEYDRLIKEAKMTSDEAKAAELMHKAEDIFMNRMTVMPIYYYTDIIMVKKHVKGWRKTPLGWFFFDQAYIEGKTK